jgi:epoxyqueuosine reductase
VGDWVFGCDLCQEVCPVNRDVQGPAGRELQRTGFSALDLVPLLTMTQEEFAARFRDTPIKRAKLVGLQRNACVALGNIGDTQAVPALGRALTHSEPLVRGHAAWALGRIGGNDACRLLREEAGHEHDVDVREEIEAALAPVSLA